MLKAAMSGYLNYAKIIILTGALLVLQLTLLPVGPAFAQQPLSGLRLLAWAPDRQFLIGSTPGRVVTLPSGTTHQLFTLWQLSPDGSSAKQLAQGLDPRLTPDGQFVAFKQLNAQNQTSLWGIDVNTGTSQPLDAGLLSTSAVTVAGDPPGRVYLSPDGRKRAILVNRQFRAALWVGEQQAPAQLILSSPGELFSDLAWRPDSLALALIRTPLGSQTDTAGELWRIDLTPAGGVPTRLSQNNVVDRSPVWRANGDSLAVVRNNQLALVSPNRLMVEEFAVSQTIPPAPSIGAMAQLVPPAHIKVIHHASNTCRNVPVGQIDTIPFEEYVKRVVPYEVFPSWPAETLKAQAVAARTYGWFQYLKDPNNTTNPYHVTDWVDYQYMCDDTFPATNQAVDDTAGEYLAYNGQMIVAMFSAENASPTKTNTNVNYLQAVDDPVSFGQTRNGHGYGMGQWGAQRWAAWHNWSYQAILRHYYSNVTLEEAGTPTGSAPPNVSLITPWSNHYLTGNQMRLLVNTSDDSGTIAQTNVYLSTPSETNLLISQAGPANHAGYVVDVSAWAEQALVANTLVLTAEAFDSSGKRGVSPPVSIGLDRVAPTGLLTTATTLTPTTIITGWPVISLTLSGSDATAGLTHIAMGRTIWQWEGENLTRQQVGGQPVGQAVSDADALNGLAMQAAVAADPAGTWFSQEITLPTPKQYRAYFRVKVNNNAPVNEVARLEITNSQTGALMGVHRLYGPDFREADTYQEFHVDFNAQTADPTILRLTFKDIVDVALDRVIVVEYPQAYTTSPTYNHLNFRLKVIDGAGNVSDDLLVLPAVQFDHAVHLPIIMQSD